MSKHQKYTMKYDYIIAGSGLSGLSLLYKILKDDELNKKNILVIDSITKRTNDKTFCFWEKGYGMFENLVSKKWNTLIIGTKQKMLEFEMSKYRYKMIRSADFYDHTLSFAAKFAHVTFKQEKIVAIKDQKDYALVTTDLGSYQAQFVFNSTRLFDPLMDTTNTLLQHFKGWFIRTSDAVFDPSKATIMDFRPSQKHGTTFAYVLPINEREALVEYTLFSCETLEESEYDRELRHYISGQLGLTDYEVTHSEFGVIPMSKSIFKKTIGDHIVNIGTAGGYTKASTGYTFQFVQRNTEELIRNLKRNRRPLLSTSLRQRIFDWYDRTLLDVLLNEKLTGEEIFTKLFQRNDAEKILEFLSNDSDFWSRMVIRHTVPLAPFVTSGMRVLL